MQLGSILRRPIAAFLALISALLMVACGGGGGSDTPAVTPTGTRPLSAEFTSRKAVAYSGYRGPNRNTPPTSAQVLEDLQLLIQGGFKLIRVFGSDDFDTGVILRTIRDNNLDMKVQLGIWIAGPKATLDAANQQQIALGVALAKAYPDIILAVSVGNETLVEWSGYRTPPADLIEYLKAVRPQVSQPVTTDDNWAVFANKDALYSTQDLLPTLDFVALHTYPFSDTVFDPSFSWKSEDVAAGPARATAMMAKMIQRAKAEYAAAKAYMNSRGIDLPIIIGETGWKAAAPQADRAHPVNQKMYYDALAQWKASGEGPRQIFYFEAFDEPWKQGDDGWGLFDVSRKARYVIEDLYPASQRVGTAYTAADAVHYVAPTSTPAITAERFYVFADQVTSGAAAPSGSRKPVSEWKAWENGTTASGAIVTTGMAEGATALQISPTPLVWGWGFFMDLPNTANLTRFNTANGRLNFSIKTTYAGRLEVGFFTGTATGNTGVDVYLPIAAGQYGYQNDGAWHQVSIPVADIVARAAPAFGQPASAALDMTLVTNGFVIADRYATTGNAAGARTPVLIDNVFWSQTADVTAAPAPAALNVAFDGSAPAFTLFGTTAATAAVAADPAGGSNVVARYDRSADAAVWAGVTVSTAAGGTVPALVYGTVNRQMTVRVFSPVVGARVLVKLESAADPALSVETSALTTVANGWETLTFNFNDNTAGTPDFNATTTYNKLSLFFNFGVSGAVAGAQTFYFDDIVAQP